MTDRIFNSMMNKLPIGEYQANPWDIYDMICPKSYKNMNVWKNEERRIAFVKMFFEHKYGFEYRFNGRISYIGTNDLDYIVVRNLDEDCITENTEEDKECYYFTIDGFEEQIGNNFTGDINEAEIMAQEIANNYNKPVTVMNLSNYTIAGIAYPDVEPVVIDNPLTDLFVYHCAKVIIESMIQKINNIALICYIDVNFLKSPQYQYRYWMKYYRGKELLQWRHDILQENRKQILQNRYENLTSV